MRERRITAGQPAKYESEEELIQKVNQYFIDGYNTQTITVGRGDDAQTIEKPLITITGLANYLGFESRQSFYDYKKNAKFSYIIKKAALFIEQHYEELVQGNSPTGPIFVLKNLGWQDRSEVEQTNINQYVLVDGIEDEDEV